MSAVSTPCPLAAEALHQLRQLIDHLHEGVLLTEADGTVVLVNDAFCQLWGLSDPAAWSGRTSFELAAALRGHAADPAEFVRRIRELRQLGRSALRDPLALGDGRVLERDFLPLPAPAGGPGRLLVRLRDVTAHRQAAGALRVAASILDQCPNPVFRVSAAGALLYANPAADALYRPLPAAEQARVRAEAQVVTAEALAEAQPRRLTLRVADGHYDAFVVPVVGEGCANVYLLDVTARVHDARALAAASARAYDTGALRGRRVLLVEDDEISRLVVRFLLEEWGAALDEAADGPAALALFARHAYDAVLTDVQMPGMNGLEVAAAIRASPDAARARVPILALTADASRAEAGRYGAAGLDDCLAKPFEEETLYRALAALLAPPTDAPGAYNLAPLRAFARGDAEFVTRVVRSFVAHVPATLAALSAAAAARRWDEVARLVRHVRPSLESVGVAEVTAALGLLENPATGGPGEPAWRAEAVGRLVAQVRRVLAELPRELPPAAPAA